MLQRKDKMIDIICLLQEDYSGLRVLVAGEPEA